MDMPLPAPKTDILPFLLFLHSNFSPLFNMAALPSPVEKDDLSAIHKEGVVASLSTVVDGEADAELPTFRPDTRFWLVMCSLGAATFLSALDLSVVMIALREFRAVVLLSPDQANVLIFSPQRPLPLTFTDLTLSSGSDQL